MSEMNNRKRKPGESGQRSRRDTSWYYNFSEPIEDTKADTRINILDIYINGKENNTLAFEDSSPLFSRRRDRCCFCCFCCPFECPGSRGRVANMDQASRYNPRPSMEEALEWTKSFEKLLTNKSGIKLFHDFLKSEYAEENLLFWLAVEKLKKETDPANIKNIAQMIYNDYVSTESPKEVSIDHKTRQVIDHEIVEPTQNTFNKAQQHVYYVMFLDCYPRFLVSSSMKDLLNSNQ
ncbi:regulator of G-protein signaling 21 [Exaiptasia diaphana]|uniref:RGS domain-containing protein n=1 Tax=Exaiptasia diaphana TaxID=2652724 RepID=A0A913XK03_EXADI|nr:regulator of G-protein signaling 21 [Exaiptasia diaphana]KXJ20301.1 Regulator of G-protein signaling 20 [Exaiptasia diaphana]